MIPALPGAAEGPARASGRWPARALPPWAACRRGLESARHTPGRDRAGGRHRSCIMKNVLAVILAGGKGTRLEPLTRDRAKPAVPFGGLYRIIDFTLSNCLNSDLRRVLLLTQYKAMSLDRHINQGWRHYFNRELGEFIDVVPPQQRIDEQWYQGTADAVYQNIYVLEKERPEYVVILAGDHIYKMNYKSMVQYHMDVGADVTVGALRVDPVEARQFGVMEIDTNQRIVGFEEKVPNPKTMPGDPSTAWARWASTSSPPGSCSSSSAATRPSPAAGTTSATTSFPR